jgi:hypothetical protein
MRKLTSILFVAALASACGGGDGTPAQEFGVACETLGSISANIGVSLQGPYASAPLSDFVDRGHIYLPANATACDREVAQGLADACAAEPCDAGWVAGGYGTDLGYCMLRIEAAFYTASSACWTCGDGVCSSAGDCADDCACGNGACELDRSENVLLCPQDCPATCGDSFCTDTEVCDLGPLDEGSGVELKDGDEEGPPIEYTRCAADCCTVRCGDGVCIDGVETAERCEQDCSVGYCGDGLCFGSENAQNCRSDCPYFVCGNSGCTEGGHCFNCPDQCDDPTAICGDGVCRGCEVISCTADCARSSYVLCTPGTPPTECPPGSCGDGTCDWGAENERTCPMDCSDAMDTCLTAGVCTEAGVTVNCRGQCTDVEAAAFACGDGYCALEENGSISPSSDRWYDCPDDCGGGACSGDFYSCLCGNAQCEPWERADHPCVADCAEGQ